MAGGFSLGPVGPARLHLQRCPIPERTASLAPQKSRRPRGRESRLDHGGLLPRRVCRELPGPMRPWDEGLGAPWAVHSYWVELSWCCPWSRQPRRLPCFHQGGCLTRHDYRDQPVGLQHSPRVTGEPGGGGGTRGQSSSPVPGSGRALSGAPGTSAQAPAGPARPRNGGQWGEIREDQGPSLTLTPRVLSHLSISGHSFPIWKKKTLALIPSLTWGHRHLGGQSRASWLGSTTHVGFLDLWPLLLPLPGGLPAVPQVSCGAPPPSTPRQIPIHEEGLPGGEGGAAALIKRGGVALAPH